MAGMLTSEQINKTNMNTFSKICLSLALIILPAGLAAQNEITVHDTTTNRDEIFDIPEGMNANESAQLQRWLAKKYLYTDTTAVTSNYNVTYGPEVYRERLQRLPYKIEMPYNQVVQKFIDRYTEQLRNKVSYMLGAGNYYIPIFEAALDAYGLPLELKYLPVMESGLDPTAISHAGAAGLWQFMISTARRYDLDINSLVDERMNPYKASWAAAKYLSDLYNIYGDWNLVLAAYNAGPQQVSKAIRRAGGERDYWKIYRFLPRETRGYVPAFIAANYVMNYYCDHNIAPMKSRYPMLVDTTVINRTLHMQQVADLCGVDIETVHALNPQYKTDIIPGLSGPLTLTLPQKALEKFIDLKDSVYNYRADELLTQRTEVEVDETEPPHVYRHHSTRSERQESASDNSHKRNNSSRSAARSRKSNNKADSRKSDSRRSKSDDRNSRRSRQKDRNEKADRSSKKSKKTRKSGEASSATVKKGDTLSDIAKRNHTTVDKLKKKNKISGSTIKPGQKLKVK